MSTFLIVSDDHSNHHLPIGGHVTRLRHDSFNGVDLYTQGGDGDEVAIDPRDLVELIAVTYEIGNFYEDGTRITTIREAEVPPPPPEDDDEYADWENDYVFEFTGADYPEGGDAGYFVEVKQSSDPTLLAPGRTFEFV